MEIQPRISYQNYFHFVIWSYFFLMCPSVSAKWTACVQHTELDWRPVLEAARLRLPWNAWRNGVFVLSFYMRLWVIVFTHSFYSVAFVLFQVHHGFYSAYHDTTIQPGILKAIKRAKGLYGDIDIMITGHSMGGAMAAFCGLDLAVSLRKTFLISLYSSSAYVVALHDLSSTGFSYHRCYFCIYSTRAALYVWMERQPTMWCII